MSSLSKAEVEDIREVFDLFDFWDGRDGMIDAVKVGDLLRCSGMNPTIAICVKHGATKKQGEKQYKFDEFLPCYEAILKENEGGTFADYMEAFKTFDREGQGFISAAEMRHVLTGYGEYLEDSDVDKIVKLIDLHEDLDGNIKYEELIKKVMQGPSAK
ncbi:Myosin essential light chain, striated adductor muscle [Clonorchis sinensis]|uniref:Myosin essential light chain, striated adductor muscle n=1 Tax=Clonorchis sinensis TaxID=79923 RepID=A0A8T1MQ21_CLOSI|nr:Myosin essential light chain, striated adductor muscle [Clonorchis sinensis]